MITGSAVRIGRSTALALAQEGASLLLHYNSSTDAVEKLEKEIKNIYSRNNFKSKVSTIQCDLSNGTAVKEMISSLKDTHKVDILINNASNFHKTPFGEIDIEEWDMVMNVNLRAPFQLSQFMGTQNLQEGCIINISDLAGVHTWPNFVHHGVSKSALLHLTRTCALNLAPKIRVNAIIPGMILPPNSMSKIKWLGLGQNIPMQNPGNPEAIIKTIKYIINNDFLTGTEIRVDGGEFLTGHANNKYA